MSTAILLACTIILIGSCATLATGAPQNGNYKHIGNKDYVQQGINLRPMEQGKVVYNPYVPDSSKPLCVGKSCFESAEVMQADALSIVTGYVGIGYNLLKGNPEGEFDRGAIDPGLLVTRKIFEYTYDEGKQANYLNSENSVPDQVDFQAFFGESTSYTLRAYSGEKSYQSQLSVSVEAEGSYEGFDFSLSAGMESARIDTEEKQRVNIDNEEISVEGRVRYLDENKDDAAYKVTKSFYNAIKDITVQGWDESTYYNFINNWGTHIVMVADVGTRKISRSYFSYSETYSYLLEKNSAGISAGGSYAGFSSSFSVDIESLNKQIDSNSQQEERITTFTQGKENQPFPVHIVLKPITDALAPEYWNDLPNGDTYESLRIADKLEYIKRARLEYPDYLRLSQVTDPLIQIPNAWPDGKYALISPKSGCPSGWSEGRRYQDTEDSGPNNYWSSSLPDLLAGSFNKNNLELYYCVKGDSATNFGLEWPKGSYCIARSGGSCQSGFSTGSIKWDDEDTSNDNGKFGILPDGSYNKDTKIEYCCRNDERPEVAINLPTDQPFVLFRYGGTCQEVNDMSVESINLRFDNEDSFNDDDCSDATPDNCDESDSDQVLHFCYYRKIVTNSGSNFINKLIQDLVKSPLRRRFPFPISLSGK